MKNFKEICMMSKEKVKEYMQGYLSNKGYKVINEDGFLYAKGDIPVLLVAHMDTVHKLKCTQIIEQDGKISSPQGIGGDDRCGIFIIMNVVKELHCSVLLCEDEETGGIGARKFAKTEYINDLDVNYMVELDRKGNNDAVFYSCDNPEFTAFITDTTGFQKAFGSFSDISVIAPAAKIAAVNLSSGYYNAHTTNEYVMYDEMMDTVEAVKTLVKTESEKFEYIAMKSIGHYNCHAGGYFEEDYEDNFLDAYYGDAPYGNKELYNEVKHDTEIELEVVYDAFGIKEQVAYASGSTKMEAWFNFFLENPSVCFNDVTGYSFC